MQLPDRILGQKERDKVENEVGCSRRDAESRDAEAAKSTRDQRVPITMKRGAIDKVHDEYDDRKRANGTASGITRPGKHATSSVGYKYSCPFQ